MLALFPICGLVLLYFEIAVVFNRILVRQATGFRNRPTIQLVPGIVGMFLAVGSLFLQYSMGPHWRVFGFPFPSAVLQSTERGRTDFVGPFTLLAVLGNALVAFFLPQSVFAAAMWKRTTRHR